jgi:hypothetical protein
MSNKKTNTQGNTNNNSLQQCGQQEESLGSKIFRTLLVGAAVGIAAYVGYEVNCDFD